jgi:hypothetical protein
LNGSTIKPVSAKANSMLYPSRIFDHPNPINFMCPVCKTSADCPVVLVPKLGTEQDGIVECEQVHAQCFSLVFNMISRPIVSQPNVKDHPAGASVPSQEQNNHVARSAASPCWADVADMKQNADGTYSKADPL